MTRLAASSSGAFRGRAAIEAGVSRTQLGTLGAHGAIERLFADTYRLTAAPRSHEQLLRAALLWAGHGAAGAGRSAGMTYGLEGVRTELPDIVVENGRRLVTQHAVVPIAAIAAR